MTRTTINADSVGMTTEGRNAPNPPGEGEAPVAWRIESLASPGEAWEWIEGREPTEYIDEQDFIVRRYVPDTARPTPATPEGLREALTDLHTIAGWLDGLASCPDLNDVAADGGVTVGMCYQQEAREFAGRFRRVLAALAREARDE